MKLPDAYKPLRVVSIGSNTFINVKVLLAHKDEPLLLLGRDSQVWLWNAHGRIIVNGSEAYLGVDFERSQSGDESTLSYEGYRMLRMALTKEENSCVVHEIDLRPAEIDFYLEGEALKVGKMQLRENTVSGSTIGIGFG